MLLSDDLTGARPGQPPTAKVNKQLMYMSHPTSGLQVSWVTADATEDMHR